MFFFRHSSVPRPYGGGGPFFGSSLIFNGLLCVFFGIAILSAPELLAYLVATFLIFVGVSLLWAGWKMRR